MATWTRIQPGFSIGVSPDAAYATELWHTDDLPGNDLSAETLLEDSALPKLLTPHPDPGLKPAVCTNKRLIRGPQNLKATVLVEYSSGDQFAAGFGRVNASASPGSVVMPFVTRFHGDWLLQEIDTPRARISRVRTVALQGDPLQIASRIDPQIGRLYTFNGVDFVLDGYDMEAPTTGILVVVNYRFSSDCPMRGINAGEVPGCDIDIPPLGSLERWVYQKENPPWIRVVSSAVGYVRGGALPGL